MEPRLESNRENWDERVAIHARSRFYDVDGWLRDAPGPDANELEALGDVAGKSLLHLQCHFGMDTLRWARAGALVTGLDFSPLAVDEAIALARRAGLAECSSFVCANVYDAPRALAGERFDVVYVNLGALCWLPDVDAWGEVVSRLLNPGGQLYLHDVHPFSSCFDDDGDRLVYGYFEEIDRPYVDDGAFTYTDGEGLRSTRTYEWNHSLGEVVSALRARGLVLDSLTEHDWTVFQQYPWLVESTTGHFVVPEGRPRVPLTFTVLAHAPF
ncbi:MAG TPA: class I SAM-dependent methyltransferase [Acidimicrobiales bacterium]|nr:class I SAM-dependent methyltransferase [Acidimicrobiales bacterium]